MGTNYYKIPSEKEIIDKRNELLNEVQDMELSPFNIERKFSLEKKDSFDSETPWDRFIDGISIHLGKRSYGWKFCWNFHDNKYYSNKEELLSFIRSGRVIDEYGEEMNVEEFIEMALSWDGKIVDEKYRLEQKNKGVGDYFLDAKYDDKIIDGLRVSSATDFC